ncbi:hypothetical protein [Streptomyces triticiradicis]|uniref:Uncharacterized protein n=1 Tax=Streptomyces triticiradicis TaxID=2651189 RepID=A0A7J5D481_9ACTN|nr:hypothetical protein [Streptomyces triticiradicis]KAB1978640.1 hypothetical protein F8144_38935 [Streptomyces triticiradicis]
MNAIATLLDGMDRGRPLLPQMEAVLRDDIDWRAAVEEHMAALGIGDLVRLARHDSETPDVDPRVLTVAERDGVGLVRINLFSRERFARLWRGGTLSPHYHRRSFATRIIKGAYHHLRFDNAGSQDTPQLTCTSREVLRTDSGYGIEWQEYHFVMFPADATVTINVHLPPAVPAKVTGPPASADTLARLRGDILTALAAESASTA